MGKNRKVPHVNSIGAELAKEGYVAFGKRAYNQTGGNCYDIAKRLAEKFGFRCPSRFDAEQIICSIKSRRRGWWYEDIPPEFDRPSPAYLIVYQGDNLRDTHIAFELRNKEFNYSDLTPDYTCEVRIPLPRKV